MSEGSGNERCYVDNAMNRRLGRAGMPLGSMVVSSRVSSASSSGSSYFGSSLSDGGRTYVDNYMNRGLDRVGMPLGSMVVSNLGNSASPFDVSNNFLPLSDSSTGYVDNYMNRGLGRVGMPLGSMVVSYQGHNASLFDDSGICRPSSYSERTYVDNYMNRGLGRVGMPLGSMVVSSKESSAPFPSYNHTDSSSLASARIENTIQQIVKILKDESKPTSISCREIPSPPKTDNEYQGLEGVSRSAACYMTESSRERSTSPSSVYSRESSAVLDSERSYVNNSMNRSLGRDGMPVGSMPVSKSSSRSSSSSKTYVDNEYNRRLGRVGLEHGSMVVSKDSGIASFTGTKHYVGELTHRSFEQVDLPYGANIEDENVYEEKPLNRKSGHYGKGSSPPSSVSSRESSASAPNDTFFGSNNSPSRKKYVDNALNRNLGRVDMPVGSKPVSKSKSRSSSSSKTYVDNEYNRRIGRVGMEQGSMVVAKDSGIASSKGMKQNIDNPKSKSSSKTYVDNEYNRRLGRVGLEHGSKDSGTASSKGIKHYVDNSTNRSLGRVGLPYGACREEVRVYRDNPFNRKLGRVGLPIGAKVQSKSGSLELKFYADNPENRRLGRVRFPLGSKPKGSFSEPKRTYCDNYLNRQLGRVGKELGTAPVTSRKKTEWFKKAYKNLRKNPDKDIDFDTFPTLLSEEEEYAFEQLVHVINRLQLEREWQEKEEQTSPVPKTSDYLLHYSGPVIEFSEINLKRIIGSGGFGKVYYGTYKDSVVAVKMLHVRQVNKHLQKEFFDEVNILSKLDNPFIVKFIGACTKPPNLCIVMEYMQMSLHEALHVGCTDMDDFTDGDRLMMIIQTLSGLEYLHDKNVAHCDIKPGNILIDHDGKKITVAKLSDFGLSMMKNETETSLSSDTGLVCHIGTPIYSSPERLRGEYLNLKQMKMSDMYSYGLVVFEILCEVQPFRNLSLRQLQIQVGWENMYPKFPDDIHPNVHLAAKLLDCWDRKPKNRPTAADFLKVMKRISCVYETLD